MATQSAKDVKKQAVEAALALAAARGWASVTLHDIAGEADIPLSTLHDHFEDRFDILAAYGRMVDQATLAQVAADSSASARDRLFDVVMTRFDVLADHRDGVIAILHSFKYDPKQAVISLPHLGRSMSWMLEAAGINTNGPKGAAKIVGMTAVYLKALWAWRDDDSADLSKTMAALDKALGHAEQWASTFRLTEDET